MSVKDINAIRDAFSALSERSNKSLGHFDERAVGIGRYVPGSSPWEKHNNGDELLYVTDGEVQLEILSDSGESSIEPLTTGSLFIVPRGKWHQLTASDHVNILYISPAEDGVDRQREHPFESGDG